MPMKSAATYVADFPPNADQRQEGRNGASFSARETLAITAKFGGVVTTEIGLDAYNLFGIDAGNGVAGTRTDRGRIDRAKARGAFSGENPARWRGQLANILPKYSKFAKIEHHAAMPFGDLRAFRLELRAESLAICTMFVVAPTLIDRSSR
jgi:hypothetical protein